MARVLVIDDDPDLRLLCRVNLKHAGHEVYLADRAEPGLEAARELRPDIVILDVMLPGRDGFDVLEELAAAYPTLPVLMLTVKSGYEDRVRGWKAGAVDYIGKPFSPTGLIEAVARALEETLDERAARRQAVLQRLSGEDWGPTDATASSST